MLEKQYKITIHGKEQLKNNDSDRAEITSIEDAIHEVALNTLGEKEAWTKLCEECAELLQEVMHICFKLDGKVDAKTAEKFVHEYRDLQFVAERIKRIPEIKKKLKGTSVAHNSYAKHKLLSKLKEYQVIKEQQLFDSTKF